MKGLLLKDYLNLKKQTKTILILVVFYFALAFTTKNANMFSSIILILFAMLPITAISYDERANWDKYGLTMPVSRTDMVLSKYILGLILSVFALLLNFIVQLFLGTQMNTENILITFVTFGLSLLFTSFLLPIMFKYGVEKGRMIMYIVLLIPTFIALFLPKITNKLPSEEILDKALYFFPLAVIIIYVLSVIISINVYNKKEF